MAVHNAVGPAPATVAASVRSSPATRPPGPIWTSAWLPSDTSRSRTTSGVSPARKASTACSSARVRPSAGFIAAPSGASPLSLTIEQASSRKSSGTSIAEPSDRRVWRMPTSYAGTSAGAQSAAANSTHTSHGMDGPVTCSGRSTFSLPIGGGSPGLGMSGA